MERARPFSKRRAKPMAEAHKEEVTVSRAALKDILSRIEKIERILRGEDRDK